MGNVCLSTESEAKQLQSNLLWFTKVGSGPFLSAEQVRAAMLIRANSLLQGASGIRPELIERFIVFLNHRVTPRVHQLGSIGASGDLCPLGAVAGALIGLDDTFLVEYDGEEMTCTDALAKLGLQPIQLEPKEGLALINGTSMMTGIAALCVRDAQMLLRLVLGFHALAIQALVGTNQSYHPFVHALKPHPGQILTADRMLHLLDGSKLIRDELEGERSVRDPGEVIQDRYSLRCLPQYLGPIVEGIETIERQITIEANSVTDNPLIDVPNNTDYHGGNFLGEYVGVAMDQLRYYFGLLTKHMDAQIALLVTPEFSRGLPPSLVGNVNRTVNMGLKGLQIAGNSIMPLLQFYSHSLADRYPTHAEQFNQNVSSQGFGSANLTRQSIDLFYQYMAIALIFAVQAVDLRAYLVSNESTYDARTMLSPATRGLYVALYQVTQKEGTQGLQPLIRNDCDQTLDVLIARIASDIEACGAIPQSMLAVLPQFPNDHD